MRPAPPVLLIKGLTISGVGPSGGNARIVDSVDLTIGPGECLGIAGESGSGKSTLLLAMMGVLRQGLNHQDGSVLFKESEILGQSDKDLQSVRGGKIALIPQNASTAMTPTIKIRDQIDEVLRLHTRLSASQRSSRTLDLLGRVNLPDPARLSDRYPHELSGGQMQRAAIAMALAGEPEVLLLDEPTTGLDVTTQLAIIELLEELARASGIAMICVSHDLGVLSRLCQRIAVMYAGSLVEEGPTDTLLSRCAHPYTRALINSLPRISHPGLPNSIPGAPPQPHEQFTGCRFAPRCTQAQQDCSASRPALSEIGAGTRVACYHHLSQPQYRASQTIVETLPEMEIGRLPALAVSDLSVTYGKRGFLDRFFRTSKRKDAVAGVSFSLQKGEVLGFVGESGSGKSTILKAIAGIWPANAGSVSLAGSDGQTEVLAKRLRDRPLSQLRTVQLIFQNPDASLNPRHQILEILSQPLRLYGKVPREKLRDEAANLLAEVRLNPGHLDRYPSQLSGGERQRVAIARAFAAQPDVLLCDEITTALDVSVQAAVLKLVKDLAKTKQVATIFVSHDLAVVRCISDRIAVLYAGQLVEIGLADDICRNPRHPYTEALLSAVLEPGEQPARKRLTVLPDADADVATGCSFAPRCAKRFAQCLAAVPDLVGEEHLSRCFLSKEMASDS